MRIDFLDFYNVDDLLQIHAEMNIDLNTMDDHSHQSIHLFIHSPARFRSSPASPTHCNRGSIYRIAISRDRRPKRRLKMEKHWKSHFEYFGETEEKGKKGEKITEKNRKVRTERNGKQRVKVKRKGYFDLDIRFTKVNFKTHLLKHCSLFCGRKC